MTNLCLPELSRSTSYPALLELMPSDFCPLLFYNLAPYIFSLAQGGWFGWVRKTRRPRARKAPAAKQFTGKRVNRHYFNEVLVRCPHPEKKVVAGLGSWDANRLALRIVHDEQQACPARPRIGQPHLLDRRSYPERAERFYRLFVKVLLDSLAELSLPAAIERFDRTTGPRLTLDRTIHPCRYHPHHARHGIDQLLPDEFCPHVFWAAYPRVLACLADAPADPGFTVTHPAQSGGIDLSLEKSPEAAGLGTRLPQLALHRVSGWLGHPYELLNETLFIRVRADHRKDPGLLTGGCYTVNLKDPGVLCPAAFQAVYPYLLLAAAPGAPPWSAATGGFQICCPDCVGSRYWITN